VPSIRVLVVEDYDPFLRLIRSTLAMRENTEVVCAVSDGLEAVQKAAELKPDLILLDLGLPKLNGIEAARRIRKLVPESRIIFLSVESSPDVVTEALSLGVLGYVAKRRLVSDLLVAIETVLEGRQFVSNGLVGGGSGSG
jgi:DNA-binding NarL/FixJ family response regulator